MSEYCDEASLGQYIPLFNQAFECVFNKLIFIMPVAPALFFVAAFCITLIKHHLVDIG